MEDSMEDGELTEVEIDILKVLAAAARPMTVDEIADGLRAMGYQIERTH